MKQIHTVCLVIALGLAASAAQAQTMRTYPISQETTLARAHLVIEAEVIRVDRFPQGGGFGGHAAVTLSIMDALKGESPDTLTMRRFQLNRDGSYQHADLVPTYELGDHLVISVYWGPGAYYKPLGLYNGVFYIDTGRVRGTGVSLVELKSQIAGVLEDTRGTLDIDLKTAASVPRTQIPAEGSSAKVASFDHSHFGGRLRTSSPATWKKQYYDLGVVIKYNDDNVPNGIGGSAVGARIADAIAAWNGVTHNGLSLSYGGVSTETPEFGSASLSEESDNVIWWADGTAGGPVAVESPGPLGAAVLEKFNSDIWVNSNPGPCKVWHFGSSATAYPHKATVPWSGCTTGPATVLDYQELVMHELGHTLGLFHSINDNDLMWPDPNNRPASVPVRLMTNFDKAGAVHQHPTREISGTLPFDIVLRGD